MIRTVPYCAKAERKYAALQSRIAELQAEQAEVNRKTQECDSKYQALQLGRSSSALTWRLQSLHIVTNALHDAAQRTSIADLPADVYNMIFEFKHRAVCQRLHRWAKMLRGVVYNPIYRSIGMNDSEVAAAAATIQDFLAAHPLAILCSDSCTQAVVKLLHHPYQLSTSLFSHFTVCFDSATHLSCGGLTLSEFATRYTKIEYVHIYSGWNGDSVVINTQRPIRMTQLSYDRCSSFTFTAGVQIVPECEMGLDDRVMPLKLRQHARGDSAFYK